MWQDGDYDHQEELNRAILSAYQKSEAIVDAARKEADQIVITTKNRADEELGKKLAQAQKRAEQIVKDAEGRAEKIAREKTKQEIQRITTEAKEESERIIAGAREAANGEADRLRAKLMEEAEQLAKAGQDRASKEAQEESLKVISETRQKAEFILTDMMCRGTKQVGQHLAEIVAKTESSLEAETARLLADVTQRMKKIIEETETEVESEFGRLAKVVAEAESELGRVGQIDVVSQPTVSASPGEKVETIGCLPGVETGVFIDDAAANEIYTGQLNLEITAPFTNAQLDSLRESLVQVPGLTLVSTGGSVDGETAKAIYNVNLMWPLPLPKILKETGAVESIVVRRRNIAIALKHN